MTHRLTIATLMLIGLMLSGCGKRSVRVRNATDRVILVRLVHDAFLSGDRTLAEGQIEPYGSESFGPFEDVPLLDPIDIEVSLARSVGDLPLKHRIDKRNVSLVVESSALETWSGIVIRRDDKRFR